MLDRRRFKNPFIPEDIWNRMGSVFNEHMWDRLLRKHRMRLIMDKDSPEPAVSAEYWDEEDLIHITVSQPKLWNLDDLKFEIIQTAMHELIHANQYAAHEEQYDRVIAKCVPADAFNDYLSTFGEVQAYAHCCALDWIRGFDNTLYRYEECPWQVKRELYKQIDRWLRKYSEMYITK